MKKLLSIILVGIMILSLAACGGGDSGKATGIEGTYLSVAGEAMGMVLTGEDIAGFEIELKAGGKGTITVEGDSANIKWSLEGDAVTIKVEGEELVGTYSEDTIKFVDFMGLGMDLTFAAEGSDAADPANYMAEEEKTLVGTWTSTSVTDVLGEDMSSEADPSGLVLNFNADHTASGELNGEALAIDGLKWSMFDTFGSFAEADDCVISSWLINEDGTLEVTYDDGENYYLYICEK